MKRYFLVLMLAIMCIFVLAASASATEYTVSSNDAYQTAFNEAANGDTIVIDGALTCDIQATKSITYVLNADWQSPKMVIASNVEVSFLADGSSYKIMPTGYDTANGWLNLTQAYENVVINLAGVNGGTVTIDGTNATHDTISYVTESADLTWNFFSGSAIANFNPTSGSGSEYASIIYAATFNMYNGSEIYANHIINAPLIKAVDFNLFGGNIFGNYLTSNRIESISTPGVGAGAIYVTEQFVMYGGKIYNNIFNAHKTNGNVRGFISVPAGNTIVILGGALGVNYTLSTGTDSISAIFGIDEKVDDAKSYFYYNSNMTTGTRYLFSDTPALGHDEATGKTIWQVSSVTWQRDNWYGYCWKHIQGGSAQVAVFLEGEKKTINGNSFYAYSPIDAFIVGINAYANNAATPSQKDYTYSYSGATSLSFPSDITFWSTSGTEYCHEGKEYTMDEVTSSTPIVLYKAYDAGKEVVNGTTVCPGCGKVYSCDNTEHERTTTVIYQSYTEGGFKTTTCTVCNVSSSQSMPAIVEFKGYSKNETSTALCVGYSINSSAIDELVAVNGLSDIFEYGLTVTLAQNVTDGKPLTVDNGEVKTANESIIYKIDLTANDYPLIELKVVGDFTDRESVEILMAMYIYDGTRLAYIQSDSDNESAEVESITAVTIGSTAIG